MPNQVPLRIDISPFPPGFQGTPDDIRAAIEARAQVVTDQAYSLFVTGPTAPTSNQGPWFKNDVTPMVWDVSTGQYIPAVLDQKSLRYASLTALPANNNDYDVVILLDSASTPVGNPLGIYVWYNGAWKDIYTTLYVTQVQLQQAFRNYPSRATLTANQTIAIDTARHKITMNAAQINPDSVYDSANSRYVAATNGLYEISVFLQVDNAGGTAANMILGSGVYKNGNLALGAELAVGGANYAPAASGPWFISYSGMVSLLAGDYLEVYLSAGDGVNTQNVQVVAGNSAISTHLIRRL